MMIQAGSLQVLEQIPECVECGMRLKNVRRLVSSYVVDPQVINPHLSAARLAARQCYEACANALSEGKEVIDDAATPKISLGWTGIQSLLRNWQKELDGYERIAQNLPFSHWAGGALDNHEKSVARSPDRWFTYVNNRHTRSDHVGIGPEVLDKKIQIEGEFASSFYTQEIAEWAIARVLAFCWDDVLDWLLLKEGEVSIKKFISLKLPLGGRSFDTARDIGISKIHGHSKLYISTFVSILLVRDSQAPKGFWIKTAFPSPA